MSNNESQRNIRYDFAAVEAKWRRWWEEQRTYRTPGPGDEGFDPSRPKFYVLDMFPYPSGKGLHVGHPLGYIATDILARYKRMRGFNVLHPMGFDAFGLPAEQYALEHNVHPRVTTEQNIETMKRQLRQLSLGYDWERSFATTDPDYFRWTQWIFLKLFESWFDVRANAARPMAELEVGLADGSLMVGDDGAVMASTSEAASSSRTWHMLTAEERRTVIDGQRLAYLSEVPVNWCPGLGTVLANEEVTSEGRSERGDFPVYRRPLKQWMLRITAYADRLIDDLELIDWPEAVKLMQRHWIGRSVGARVAFAVEGAGEVIEVFTTRPDTLFGATYMVLAPEHPVVSAVTTDERRAAVQAYRAAAERRSDVDRQAEGREKTGVFTGGHAINPATGESIPIWIADYVLLGYGTGAIMAVPAHDQRDFEFALEMGLPMCAVVMPDEAWLRSTLVDNPGARPLAADAEIEILRDDYLCYAAGWPEAFCGEGENVQSHGPGPSLDGLATPEAKARITEWLAQTSAGRAEVHYKLRDWLFSRQRYWGEPFPILHAPDGQVVPVPEKQLPVELPPMDDFQPERSDDPAAPPRPPLGRAPKSWREVEIDGVVFTRELNTMPNWAGSCWYYLRYLDPDNSEMLVDEAKERYWMGATGVDLYVGGVEHAVLHLLYVRFWHKVLFDLGFVGTPEPFGRLVNQGYIQAPAYRDERGIYVPADEVAEREGQFSHAGQPVTREYGKMGKSLKNMVTPDDVVMRYGCDTLRMYEMYLGPVERSKPWNTDDIVGISRFVNRVWRNFVDDDGGVLVVDEAATEDERRLLHGTIAKVGKDMEEMGFNTAIAALIELNNALVGREGLPREIADPFVRMLAPLAPHLAEELWQRLGEEPSVTAAAWPAHDPAMLVTATVELALQINGKVRGRIDVPADAPSDEIEVMALADEEIARAIDGREVKRVIVVPGRLVNVVLG